MEKLNTIKTVSVEGSAISGYGSDYVFQRIACDHDYYEGALLRKWTAWLNGPKYIADVGANLGNHTIYWAKHLDLEKIVSFEPFDDNYRLLQKNIEDNELSCVTAVNVAIGGRDGYVKVSSFSPDNYGGTSFQYVEGAEGGTRVCTLDHITAELNVPRLDLVKIDTEGFELSVLEGMQGILHRDRPALWIETGKDTVAEVFRSLCSLDYGLADISGANLLFIQRQALPGPEIELHQVLRNDLEALERANTYYANYEKSKGQIAALTEKVLRSEADYQTTKGWLACRNEELAALRAEHEKLKQELAGAQERAIAYQSNYETAKGWLADRTKECEDCKKRLAQREQALASVEERYADCKKQLEQKEQALAAVEEELARRKDAGLDGCLWDCIQENDLSVQLLMRAKKELQQLQAQNAYLKSENAGYARKFAKITSTWYGRLALECYHILQKSKWRVQGILRRIKRR